jgi:hypothetical protein
LGYLAEKVPPDTPRCLRTETDALRRHRVRNAKKIKMVGVSGRLTLAQSESGLVVLSGQFDMVSGSAGFRP